MQDQQLATASSVNLLPKDEPLYIRIEISTGTYMIWKPKIAHEIGQYQLNDGNLNPRRRQN